MPIWFNNEFENFRLHNKRALKNWITNIILAHNKSPGTINYIFLSDSALLEINKEFLSHYTFTDIISFDYSGANIISGDIYISVERVKANAVEYGDTLNEEMKRVIIHGILHFLGFRDKTRSEKEYMSQKENEALKPVKDLLIVQNSL